MAVAFQLYFAWLRSGCCIQKAEEQNFSRDQLSIKDLVTEPDQEMIDVKIETNDNSLEIVKKEDVQIEHNPNQTPREQGVFDFIDFVNAQM